MKSKNETVRSPSYMRAAHGESTSDKDMSIGDVLREARKSLLIKQFAVFVIIIVVIAVMAYLAAFGYVAQLFDFITDNLM